MNALKPRPAFNVLIMSDVEAWTRADRDGMRSEAAVGCRSPCFSYLEDREVLMESATDKCLLGAMTFAADLEREKARQRTYDAMERKARAGHVTGGRVFGYDNIEIVGPDGKRSHVERRINEAEAAIVRRIFELCVGGTGYTRIAKLLNAEHAPAPRAQQARPVGWAPTSINEILHRSLYRGEIVWNRTRKRNRWGQQDQRARPSAEWMHVSVPDLRVVSEELWSAAHSRLATIKAHLETASGGQSGGRRRDIDSHYLLPGFARCAVCGGSLGVVSRQHGQQRAHFYACIAYHKRGTAVCGNGLSMRIERVDMAVLSSLAGDVLRPAVVQAVIDGVLEAVSPTVVEEDLDRLKVELCVVERELARLSDAIASGGQLAPLLSALTMRETRRDALTTAINARESLHSYRINRKPIEDEIRDRVGRWRSLLTKHVADGRQLLREVLSRPLRFTPDDRTYRFEGEAAMGRLLQGMVGLPTFVASPTGFEPSGKIEFIRTFAA